MASVHLSAAIWAAFLACWFWPKARRAPVRTEPSLSRLFHLGLFAAALALALYGRIPPLDRRWALIP